MVRFNPEKRHKLFTKKITQRIMERTYAKMIEELGAEIEKKDGTEHVLVPSLFSRDFKKTIWKQSRGAI